MARKTAAPIPDRLTVVVRYQSGTHITRAFGKTATATSGAGYAAVALAKKLWGPGRHGFTQVCYVGCGVEQWAITKARSGHGS